MLNDKCYPFINKFIWNRYLRLGLVDLNPDVEKIKNTRKELQENTLLRDQLLKEKRNIKAKLKKIKNAALVNDQEYNKN